ncbi:S-adenosyl-L-methionine-dependent methyltransferase [Lizonia empirigonia]|nr:S-adenosyl-L-methionine-dependent methyltransferase [Lizonia empirigonia]
MTFIQDIVDAASKGPAGLEEADRLALLHAAEKLSLALENPLEKSIRLFFSLYDPIAIRIGVDLNLIDIALANNGPITAAALAEKSKADIELIHRILRLLVSTEVFTLTATEPEKQYTPAPFGHALATGSPLRSAVLHFSQLMPATAFMPDYFAKNGYTNPSDARTGPFSFAYQCNGESYFDFIARPGAESARMATAFNETMALQKAGEEETFVTSYPVSTRLAPSSSSAASAASRILFVDIGGGVGHQLVKFQARAASLPGTYVLLDLAGVVAQAPALPGVTKLAHSFFEPLPAQIHGAKAFYLRMILHDWPAMQATTILRNIVAAMAHDSVLLIHELILPETGTGHFEARMDWHMMNIGALQRTEGQWRDLVGSVGLEINGIWWEEEGTRGRRALIECGLRE